MEGDNELFVSAMHLWGVFYANMPPDGCDPARWRRMETAALRIYRSAALVGGDAARERHLDLLRAIMRAVKEIERILVSLDRSQPLVLRAMQLLLGVVDGAWRELDDTPAIRWN